MLFGKKDFSSINALLNHKFKENKCLIAVHRGSFTGNIIQNTIPAYICAFKLGADLVECDINRTVDGVLYSFHDGYENIIFHTNKSIKDMTSNEVENFYPFNFIGFQNKNHINKLNDILEWLPNDKLLNIDRAWDIFPFLFEELDKYPEIINRVIIKAPIKGCFHGVPVSQAIDELQKHHNKYMFMALCYNLDDVKMALSLNDINLVGCEIIAKEKNNDLLLDESISFIHEHNLFTWVNAITLGDYNQDPLYNFLDDDISIIDNPDLGWGKLLDKKIDIIQTDWPALLYSYREKRMI